MTSTKFKLIFKSEPPDIDLVLFRQSLPKDFEVIRENDGIYVLIPSAVPEDRKCQFLIDRELDRHYYLTFVKIKASMVTKRIYSSLTIKYGIHGGLDNNIKPQKWNYELPLQLRLWSIAVDTNEIILKVILYFQVIELAYPEKHNYPEYKDSRVPPAPLTECKFLRNMAAHSGDVSYSQQERYCEYLKIPPLLHDPTDPAYVELFNKKIGLLEQEAKKVIDKSL